MAVDPCFLAFLRDVVDIWRPRTAVSEQGLLVPAAYELGEGAIPCALQPLRSSVTEALTGRLGQESHVAYLEPTAVAVGDLLVERRSSGYLAAQVEAGDECLYVSGSSMSAGWAVVGEDCDCELALIQSVEDGLAQLSAGVARDHAEGAAVWQVGCYEVVEARDEAGAGHHLRVSLRQWGG
jgi:hypothetical protein